MSQFVLVSLFLLGASGAILTALLCVRRRRPREGLDMSDDVLVFLIRDGELLDSNFAGRRVLDRTAGAERRVDRLRLYLAQHFQAADELIAEDAGDATLQSRDGQIQATREVAGDTIRLRIVFVSGPEPGRSDIHALRAIERELDTLRANTAAAPFLLWRQNAEGEVVWVNKAYLDAAQAIRGGIARTWPLPAIFPALRTLSAPNSGESRRIAIPGSDGAPDAWYDCHVTTVGEDMLCTAIPADEAVRAENRRREFTQTLTKTFAELAIGLAIFDRSRRLVLFNPALLDLTHLPTDFLTSRPSLVSFLDRLRENRAMPEPRDYRSWRDQIAELEEAAADGTYSETWCLPDGQTYHVTGRPHPDGAVALLFEDISAEMSLNRHFRAELEQLQSVIDALDDAVAVFSPGGEITLSNAAYRELWQFGENELAMGGLGEAMRRWRDLSAPTPTWGDFRDFAQSSEERAEWSATVALRDGRNLHCRFAPHKGGATMAIFRVLAEDRTPLLRKAV